MDKARIIGLGLNGLVGSRIAELLSNKFTFIAHSRSTGLDITNPSSLEFLKKNKYADFVLHLSAKTDVDGCEKDKELRENGEAWKINVEGVGNVAEICRDTGKKIIYISTDFVFDGQKPKGDAYSEEDTPNPINWYAKTKYEGEKKVIESGANFIILRTAFPYRAKFNTKLDFMRTIKGKLEEGLSIKAVTDQIFCPTFIDDIAISIETLIKNDAKGIYHAVGGERLSPFDAAVKIAEAFGLDKSLITQTTREEFFRDRAPRPYNLSLKNDKIARLGIQMRGFGDGLEEVKYQI